MVSNKRRVIYSLFVLILVFFEFGVDAQSLGKIEKKAINSFERSNYVKARDNFLVLKDSAYNINSTSSYLARCYIELHEPLKAYDLLSVLPNADQENAYLLILACYLSEHFEEANQLMQNFQDTANFDVESIKSVVGDALFNYDNAKGYLIQNFGSGINSKDREYSAVMYNDFNKLLFTSRKEHSDVLATDGLAFETILSTAIDSTDSWQKSTPLNIKLEQEGKHDATVQVYGQGKKMISYHDGQLYSSVLKDGVWSKDKDLIIHGFEGSDTHCFITSDEQSIFFASDYLSNGEHLDLFFSNKEEDDKWSEPEPLVVFNTEYDEDSPFLANDSTFYFSSRGHNSMGGYDIFKSNYDRENNSWGAPVNLGHPINTVAEDTYFSTDGKLGYLSSSRLGGYGSLDLYRVFLFNKVKVEGTLLDKSQQPISDVEIDVKYDTTFLKSHTDINGHYEMFVPINTQMHISFIKDSLNIHEGEFIANIFFKDKNNNEFNFFIDYSDIEPEIVGGETDEETVKHISIDVKNDYADNAIISSVAQKEEQEWAESLNKMAEENRKEELSKRESTYVTRTDENTVQINSANLRIREAVIRGEVEPEAEDKSKENPLVETKTSIEKESKYTVQVLAMPINRKTDISYFDNLDASAVNNTEGKDGLNRYYIGNFETKKSALKAMRAMRQLGYSDAFIRKLVKYEKL